MYQCSVICFYSELGSVKVINELFNRPYYTQYSGSLSAYFCSLLFRNHLKAYALTFLLFFPDDKRIKVEYDLELGEVYSITEYTQFKMSKFKIYEVKK